VVAGYLGSLGPMVAIRTSLSALVAPILGGAVYAWLTLSSPWPAIVPKYPTVGALIIWGSIVCLIFELAIILPLQFALRPRGESRAIAFVVFGSALWLVLSFLVMLLLGADLSAAWANAVAIFLPGATVVLAFWLLGGRSEA